MDQAIVKFLIDRSAAKGNRDVLSEILNNPADLSPEDAARSLLENPASNGIICIKENTHLPADSTYRRTLIVLQDSMEVQKAVSTWDDIFEDPQIMKIPAQIKYIHVHCTNRGRDTYHYTITAINGSLLIPTRYTLREFYIYLCGICSQFRAATIGLVENDEALLDEFYKTLLFLKLSKEPLKPNPQALAALYLNSEYSDANLRLMPEERIIPIHRVILAINSGFFAALFSTRWNGNIAEYDIQAESAPFLEILRFIYTGLFNEKNIGFMKLYEYVDYFDIPTLMSYIRPVYNFIKSSAVSYC